MALQFHESPFHATHDTDTASKMALKMDLSIFITDCIKKWASSSMMLRSG